MWIYRRKRAGIPRATLSAVRSHNLFSVFESPTNENMPYDYQEQKSAIFSEAGQRMFLKIRDHTKELLAKAGAVRCQEMMAGAGGGDSWNMLACVDRLVELGEIREIPQERCAGQDRVFVLR